jgi:hypothetical protein
VPAAENKVQTSGMFSAAENHGANHHDFTINHHRFTTFLPSKNTVEIAISPYKTPPTTQNFFFKKT